MAEGPGLLSTILDTTGERIKERMKQSMDMDRDKRDAQAKVILASISAVDENGHPMLSEAASEDALKQYEDLYKHNKAAKDIVAKARDVFGKIFNRGGQGAGVAAQRAAEQTQSAMGGGPGGGLVSAPDQQAAAQPAQQQQQPTAQPIVGAPPTPPPQRSSMPSMIQAASPARGAYSEEEHKNRLTVENNKTEHGYRMEEIRAGKDDKEIDSFTNADGFRVTRYQRPDGTRFDDVGTQKVRETGAEKGLQDVEVVFQDDSHGPAFFNPDPSNPGYFRRGDNGKMVDITTQVKGKYFAPSASVQLLDRSKGSIDGYIDMAKTGQIKSITEIPSFMRSDVVQAMKERGVSFTPPTVRERKFAVQSARNLIAPIDDLINKINNSKDLTEKVEMSALLENYTGSIATMLSRSLGERGVVTEGDVNRATGLVPGWKAANFAPGYAQKELGYLKDVINSQDKALDIFLKDLGGTTPPPERTSGASSTAASGKIRVIIDPSKGAAKGNVGEIDPGQWEGFHLKYPNSVKQ